MRYNFTWDPAKEATNIRKHGIAFRQAASVFHDPNQVSIFDEDHSEDEERWITIGVDNGGVLRVVIHTFEQRSSELIEIRIISARKATRTEIAQYEG
jgi:uncharacterized DUF497 family protein